VNGGEKPGSTLAAFLALSRPWLARPRTLAALLLLAALTAAQVALAVRFNLWNADLFDALERRDTARLWREVGVFALLVLGIVASNAAQLGAKRALALSWRRALTERLLAGWTARGVLLRLERLPGAPANPEGRIAEDARIATEHVVELASSLLYCALLLVSFLAILWSLSGTVALAGLAVPGHLVWLALLYAAGGAVAAFALGRPLTRASEQRQAAEADFRYELSAAREHAEGVAAAEGEGRLATRFAALFEAAGAAWRRQSAGLRNLMMFQSAYITLAPVFPLLIGAPRFLSGELSLGALMQSAQGFQQAVAALSWPVDNTARLAEWRASAERLLALADAVEATEDGPGIRVAEAGAALAIERLTLREPSGRPLAAPLTGRFEAGQRVEVSGEGSSVLFAAIAGTWPWGEGEIQRPAGGVAILPHRPWLPAGRLADLLAPPGGAPREALAAACEGVGLARLADRLEQSADWEAALDEAERLRLAFARLLLRRPAVALIEDPAPQLGLEEAQRLLGILCAALPATVLLVADHGTAQGGPRLVLAPPEGVPPGREARAMARAREFRLVDWLRRGFGHGADG
jgi:vitamin B12/bleomycin/antimicrobial peptide transport system ATP-binding/permease protein